MAAVAAEVREDDLDDRLAAYTGFAEREGKETTPQTSGRPPRTASTAPLRPNTPSSARAAGRRAQIMGSPTTTEPECTSRSRTRRRHRQPGLDQA